ncbi:hypothetical protein pb186bvf_004800 [Paramecium bursaria]
MQLVDYSDDELPQIQVAPIEPQVKKKVKVEVKQIPQQFKSSNISQKRKPDMTDQFIPPQVLLKKKNISID